MLAARHNTGLYGFIFTAVVFMKSIFYFTISYSSGVEQELYFRFFQSGMSMRYTALLWDFDIAKNDILRLKYTRRPRVEEMKKTKAWV